MVSATEPSFNIMALQLPLNKFSFLDFNCCRYFRWKKISDSMELMGVLLVKKNAVYFNVCFEDLTIAPASARCAGVKASVLYMYIHVQNAPGSSFLNETDNCKVPTVDQD
ncbi:hypothetical protein TWF718_009553 [Orbilia javanica]|uniref:Uncharacterized protein n=1 Tax=Orbilia javanica TaxID=47235 RepID=A0AAN8RLI0_9PEZI